MTGGSGVKNLFRGRFEILKIFKKNVHLRFLGFLTTVGGQGALIPKMSLHLSALGAIVWELGLPKDVIFADYFWQILRIAELNFRVISHVDSLSPGTFSAIFRMGDKGSEHPEIDPQEIPVSLHPLLTHFECPHKNFGSHRICRGTRPLPNGEESTRISASSPEIWDSKYLTQYWGWPR